jgi:hypothetical protein
MTRVAAHPDASARGAALHGLLAFAATALLAVSAQWRGFVNPFVANDDVRQQLFWMRRWLDPQLYPPDILNEYARSYVPWGVQGLYRLAAQPPFSVDPLLFSKYVAVALLTLLGGIVFLSARRMGGKGLGWLALGLFWLMPAFIENISGGLARAFAAPLLALFLYAQLAGSRFLAHVALWAQALFIPYVLPICLLASALHWAAWKLGAAQNEPPLRGPLDALSALSALGVAVAWQQGMAAAGFGPLPWREDMAGRPEFGVQGRYPMLPVRHVFWELVGRPWGELATFNDVNIVSGVIVSAVLLPAMAAGLLKLDWRGLRLRPAGPAMLLFASLLLFFAAKALLLKLFIPSRYLEHTTNLFYAMAVPLLLSPLVLPGLRKRTGLAVLLLVSALAVGAVRQHGRALYDYSDGRPLYEAAWRTPKDARFAGHPELMDNVLTFGRRNVYASFELAHPWSVGYWRTVGPRLEKEITAYYAADPEAVRRFCAEEGVDFLVVDRRHFEREYMRGSPLFEPLRDMIRRRADDPAPFALLSGAFPGQRVTPDITLIDMRRAGAKAQ